MDIGLALLPEDAAVKGFPPLMEALNKRSRLNLTRIEQVCVYIDYVPNYVIMTWVILPATDSFKSTNSSLIRTLPL